MRFTTADTAEKFLPPRLSEALAPLLRQFDDILLARNERSETQRMALVAFAVRVISAAIAFVSQIILARWMGEFEYGIFVFVWVMAIILGNLSCLGFHTAVIRFLPHYRSAGAIEELRGLAATARIFAMATASLVAVLGLVSLALFGEHIESYYLVPLYLGVFTLPMIALGDVLDGTSRANNWPLRAMVPTYLVRPLLILAAMALAHGFGFSQTARTALGCAIVATYLTTLGQFAVVKAGLTRRFARGDFRFALGTWLKVAFPIFLIEGFYFLLTNSDVLVVGFFLEPEKVAVYFAAAKTMALVHFVYFAVKAGVAPRMSTLFAAGHHSELEIAAREATAWTFWPSLLVGGLVLALGQFLLSLFGPSFTEGHVLMAILLAGILAKAMVGPSEVLLTMAGQQQICALVYFGTLAANIVLNVLLIPLLGLAGAAIATMSAMMVEAVLLHIVVRQRLGIHMFVFAGRLARD